MKKDEELYIPDIIYDIIFGQIYVLKPREYIDIKRISRLISCAKTAESKCQLQRQNNGQNR